MSRKAAPRRWANPAGARIEPDGPSTQASEKMRQKAARVGLEEDAVSTPHDMVRGALFKAGRTDTRTVYEDYVKVATHHGTTLFYRGTQLVMFDLLVWTKVIRQARQAAHMLDDGTMVCRPISFNLHSLCVLLGIDPNAESYSRVADSLDALWSAELVLQHPNHRDKSRRDVRFVRLLSECATTFDASEPASEAVKCQTSGVGKTWTPRQVTLTVGEGALAFFAPGDYFQLDSSALKRLMKVPLAAWLFVYLASNRSFAKGMLYDRLRTLTGLSHRPMNKFRQDLRAALELLLAHGHIGSFKADDARKFTAAVCMVPPSRGGAGHGATVRPVREPVTEARLWPQGPVPKKGGDAGAG